MRPARRPKPLSRNLNLSHGSPSIPGHTRTFQHAAADATMSVSTASPMLGCYCTAKVVSMHSSRAPSVALSNTALAHQHPSSVPCARSAAGSRLNVRERADARMLACTHLTPPVSCYPVDMSVYLVFASSICISSRIITHVRRNGTAALRFILAKPNNFEMDTHYFLTIEIPHGRKQSMVVYLTPK